MPQNPYIQKREETINGKKYQGYMVVSYEPNEKGELIRRRETFKSRREAQAAVKEIEIKREREEIIHNQIGEKAKELTTDDLLDAAAAVKILQRVASLERAAKYFMEHNPIDGTRYTIAEAAKLFVASRAIKGRRMITVKGYKDKLSMLIKDMGERCLADIREHDIDEWLEHHGKTATTTISYLRHLSSFFQYFVRKKILPENPVSAIERPGVDKPPITFLSVKDTRRLLDTAAREYPDLVPYVAIGLFAGLRPTEMHGQKSGHPPLDWRNIDCAAKIITVTAAQDKLRQGRHVDMSENLIAWLSPHRKEFGAIHYGRTMFKSLCQKSGIPYSKDVMRHTTATHHYAKYRNDGLTAALLGDTIQTIRKHYVNPLVKKEDAEAFWAIMPAPVEGNVIQFVSNAS